MNEYFNTIFVRTGSYTKEYFNTIFLNMNALLRIRLFEGFFTWAYMWDCALVRTALVRTALVRKALVRKGFVLWCAKDCALVRKALVRKALVRKGFYIREYFKAIFL